jgi:hypothetical protein
VKGIEQFENELAIVPPTNTPTQQNANHHTKRREKQETFPVIFISKVKDRTLED